MPTAIHVPVSARVKLPVPDDGAWCSSTPKRTVGGDGAVSGLKSVGTALDVLECFAADSELGVSDVARKLGIAKSTAHRLLHTLGTRGFIHQNQASGLYRLGIHLFELGQLVHSRDELRHAALGTLRELAAISDLTVNFAVPDGADVVYVERIENVDGARLLRHLGRRLPSHTTSAGKVLAAHNRAVYAARVNAGFPPRLSGTIRSAEEWARCIERVRRDGYATSNSESIEQTSTLAAAVLQHGVAIASVSVLGPTENVAPRIKRLVPLVRAAARRIAVTLPAHEG